MLTVVAFIVALGLLIAVHEYGHYRVAVACGVKVLRFSVGFGKTLYRWQPKRQHPGQNTEFVIGAFPLGGYVKMLDEREGPVRARGAPSRLQHPAPAFARRHRRGRTDRQPAAGGLALHRRQLDRRPGAAARSWPVRWPASLAEQAGPARRRDTSRGPASTASCEPVQSFEDLRWR